MSLSNEPITIDIPPITVDGVLNRIRLGICLEHPRAKTPVYSTDGAAGADLHAVIGDGIDAIIIPPGERAMIETGIALSIPVGFEVQIRPRSGLALKNGVTVLNTPGTIDSDYRGQIGVVLINHGADNFVVREGDRIAQMVIAPVLQAYFSHVESMDETDRGTGGFGSTGVSA